MDNQGRIIFPCPRMPEETRVAKLLGLYQQRQEGLWMQRVKVLGGILTPRQWRGLGRIAKELTPATPLHLTTRQDIEMHGLTAEQVPQAQQMMAKVGLTGLGACGDSLRNVTVCPCSGILTGTVDLVRLGREIHHTLEAEEGIFSLPRKFKISLSCGDGCGQPWINDLGLVAHRREGQWGFFVTAAGSLGRKPLTAMSVFEWLPASDVMPLAVAAVRVFAAHGDREHRHRARLRHVRERLGEERFATMLRETFEDLKAEHAWPEVKLPEVTNGLEAGLRLTFSNGDITPEAAEALAELAARDNIRIRIANHHHLVVFGQDETFLQKAVGRFDALREAARPQVSVVACPGTRWCRQALVDTNALAGRVRAELGEKLPLEMTVCISGCPNGCAHSAVADIGLIGLLGSRDAERKEAFNIFAGGGMGQNDMLSRPVAERLSADQTLMEVARVAGEFSKTKQH